jgi:hypothetical protein
MVIVFLRRELKRNNVPWFVTPCDLVKIKDVSELTSAFFSNFSISHNVLVFYGLVKINDVSELTSAFFSNFSFSHNVLVIYGLVKIIDVSELTSSFSSVIYSFRTVIFSFLRHVNHTLSAMVTLPGSNWAGS